MEWGDTGLVGWRAGTGLDWALNTILNIFSEAQPGHCLFFISNTELPPIRAEYEERSSGDTQWRELHFTGCTRIRGNYRRHFWNIFTLQKGGILTERRLDDKVL